MKRFVYPLYVTGVLLFVGAFIWLDSRRESSLSGGAIWVLVPVLLIFAVMIVFMRLKYRGFFETLHVNPASEVFCNQERLPEMPEAFGIWPTGRLFLAEANSDGLVLHDRTGVVARIPRQWIDGVEIDYVEFYRVQFAPAFVLSGTDGVSLPFVPSSRMFPGNLGTTARRTRRIADEFTRRLA